MSEATTQPEKTNRDIEAFLSSGALLHIDMDWGFEQLENYMAEIQQVNAGVPFDQLGIKERKLRQMPKVINAELGGLVKLENQDLSNADVPQGSIALLTLSGVMRAESGLSNRGAVELVDDIRAALSNPNIEGILLETNTGGGEVLAGQMLNSALNESPKAVVVYSHLLASAGIIAALPADEIIAASEMAKVGSIGTVLSMPKWLPQMHKNSIIEFYASKSTNKNKGFRDLLEGDSTRLQADIDAVNENFLSMVKKHRTLKGNIDHTLSGEVFTAKDAKSRGLIDGVGNFQYALTRLRANINRRKKSQ